MKARDLVIHLVENYKPDDELAYEVLRRMVRHHDCEIGMTWLSMDAAIEQVLEERT